MRARGSITIYLALTFIVSLSLFLTLIESARDVAIRMKVENAMDLSMNSILAEYNRALLEQYDLLFVDTSYGSGYGSMGNVASHLEGYMNDNFACERELLVVKDLLNITAQDAKIIDFSLASDDQGQMLKRQAVSFMKDTYGASILNSIQDQLDTVESNELLTTDITSQRESNQSTIDNTPRAQREVAKDQWEEVELENPADQVNCNRGILTFVINADEELSTVGINPQNYISTRDVNTGSGLLGRSETTALDEMIFNEYMIQKMGCYTNQKEDGLLKYQLEYVLKGKDSDIENLKAVVSDLMLLRETANVVYLFANEPKKAEAMALATTVATAAMLPELAPAIQISILFAWAYAETVYDVRSLLQGGKIALIKSDSTWHYSLENMVNFASDSEVANDPGGISYVDYLRVFLAVSLADQKTMRAMDIIEMDVRTTAGNEKFRLDQCMDYVEAEVFTSSGYGYSHSIDRTIYYY